MSMDAKNTDEQGIEQNNNDDGQNYGKLLAIIVATIATVFIFFSIVGGAINFFEKLLDDSAQIEKNKAITTQLRNLAAEINTNAPIHINDVTIITSAAVDESATLTFRGLMPNLTSKDIDDKIIDGFKTIFNGMACKNEIIYAGFHDGASMRFVMTTVDGYEIDSGVISSASCN